MKYDQAFIYSKQSNLLDYLYTDKVSAQNADRASENVLRQYGQEREVECIVLLRFETVPVSTRKGFVPGTKVFCKIRCPISPLPVKGEFELASIKALNLFLTANGWRFKQKLHARMFE